MNTQNSTLTEFMGEPYLLVAPEVERIHVVRDGNMYDFTLPGGTPPGDCVYGCTATYHPCGRYPKGVVSQIADWLENESIQFPQIEGWEKTMEAFKRAASAIRHKWGGV